MSIHLIGSNGFIGKSIINLPDRPDIISWSHNPKPKDNYFDLYDQNSWESLLSQKPKKIILLSWPGLPNYNKTFHITRNLVYCTKLIKRLIEIKAEKIAISGTCFEYGMKNGCLKENSVTDPVSLYGIAKDSLRKASFQLTKNTETKITWLRIFYIYGSEQNTSSLFPSLLRAIKNKDKFFNLSSGRQIRDFIEAKDVAKNFLKIIESPNSNGIYNCGSGNPLSISDFIKNKVKQLNSDIILNFGSIPDRDNEPISFWANMEKFKRL